MVLRECSLQRYHTTERSGKYLSMISEGKLLTEDTDGSMARRSLSVLHYSEFELGLVRDRRSGMRMKFDSPAKETGAVGNCKWGLGKFWVA